MAQICRPESAASLPLRRRRFDDELDCRGGEGDRWLLLLRTLGDFEPSTELRLRDRDVADRGDRGEGVRLN
jgi:hypothetical protein